MDATELLLLGGAGFLLWKYVLPSMNATSGAAAAPPGGSVGATDATDAGTGGISPADFGHVATGAYSSAVVENPRANPNTGSSRLPPTVAQAPTAARTPIPFSLPTRGPSAANVAKAAAAANAAGTSPQNIPFGGAPGVVPTSQIGADGQMHPIDSSGHFADGYQNPSSYYSPPTTPAGPTSGAGGTDRSTPGGTMTPNGHPTPVDSHTNNIIVGSGTSATRIVNSTSNAPPAPKPAPNTVVTDNRKNTPTQTVRTSYGTVTGNTRVHASVKRGA